MSKTLACVLAFVTALMLPLAAGALGLGEIKLNSALNQKLSADILIVGAASDELDSLQVTLASPAQFKQAGLEYPAVLDKLTFQVVRKSDGTAYLHITSPQPIREPFLDFLIDAKWDNGELLREYTVLLNPPNFESASKPAPTPAPAPAQQAPAPSPTASLVAPETTKPAAKPSPSAAPAPAPKPVKTTPMPAPSAATPAPTPIPSAPAPAATALGSNYGPIHRGETLSEIANKLRPSDVTLNQMMIAIYRANPEVFMHNINRMKAGYVMRIPSASDIQAVTVHEANSAVRTQIQEWRASRGLTSSKPAKSESSAGTPALQLVAPSSAAEATENQVPGGSEKGTGAVAEGKPAATSKPAETPAETTPATPPPLPAAPAAGTQSAAAPVTVKSGGLAAVQSQAGKLNKQPENKALPLPAEKPAVTKPLATSKPEAKKPEIKHAKAAASGGIMGTLLGVFSNLWALLTIAVVVILVFVGFVMKRRFSHTPKTSPKSGPKSMANWGAQEDAGADDLTLAVTTRTKTRQAKNKSAPALEPAEEPAAVEESAPAEEPSDSDKTVLVPPPAEDEAAIGGGTVKLDDSDPVAEADFHMAYGLYDQAADVLKKALAQDPGRRDVKMKLLEVYFTAGDAANFVDVARGLHDDLGGASDKDWENVAIMGRQVAPDEPLFTASGAESGTSSSVDIALDGGGTDTMVSDLDPLAGAFEETQAEPHAGTEILSGTQMLSDSEPGAPAETALDLGDFPGLEADSGSMSASESGASAEPAADNSLEFSLPDLEPDQAASEAAPEPELAPASEPAAAAPASDGLEFDLGDLNIEPTPIEKPAASTEPEPAAEEPSVSTDFGTDSQVEFDNALKELSDFVNTNVPPQEEEAPSDGGLGAGLSLDGEMPSMTESAAPSEDAGANSLSEVGTKLDLARAYIDMGDPDGAKSILDEVMEEGNAQQKQEAQELMQHLG